MRARISRPGAGRPTREQAEARQAELLDRALDMFLDKGFELATIEAIAASVGMTKRTIYASYADKSALFKASVRRAIERYSVSIETLRALESPDLEASLVAVAKLRIRNVMTPAGIKPFPSHERRTAPSIKPQAATGRMQTATRTTGEIQPALR